MHRFPLSLSLFAAFGILSLGHAPSTTAEAPVPTAPTTQNPNGGNHAYTLHSLRGRHGFSYSGALLGIGAVASSGRIDFDGHGNLSANYTTSVNGIAFTGWFTGTYTMQANGTGTVQINLPVPGQQANGTFVLVDHGKGTFFTATDAGYSVTGRTVAM